MLGDPGWPPAKDEPFTQHEPRSYLQLCSQLALKHERDHRRDVLYRKWRDKGRHIAQLVILAIFGFMILFGLIGMFL